MAEWVALCDVGAAPTPGHVAEFEVNGIAVCVANVNGELSALDNICPHRGGPLGQGWIEGEAVVCPWHSWAFNVRTGVAEYPEKERVEVFPLKVESGRVLIALEGRKREGEGNQGGNLLAD